MKQAAAPSSVAPRLTPLGQSVLVAVVALAVLLVAGRELQGVVLIVVGTVAAFAVAASAGRWQLTGLLVEPLDATSVFAARSFPLDVQVTKEWGRGAARDLVVGVGPESASRIGFLPAVPSGETVAAAVLHPALQRGRHSDLAVRVSSTYPLGLIVWTASFTAECDLLVLPRLGTVANLERFAVAAAGVDLAGTRDRRGEEEFHGLREWREGESLRRVHWKLTARRGRRVLRDLRSAGRFRVHVVLSPEVRRGAVGGPRGPFERAVSLAATLCEHFLRREHPVRLSLLGQTTRRIERRRGRSALFPMLAALAETTPAAPGSLDAAVARLVTRGDEIVLQVSAGSGARVPGARVLDVEDASTRRVFRRALGAAVRLPLGWGR